MKPNHAISNRSKSMEQFNNHDDYDAGSSSANPITMSKADCMKLLSKMEHFGTNRKLSTADWESIKFDNYSSHDCRTTYTWLWRKAVAHMPSREKFDIIHSYTSRMKEAAFYNMKFPKSAYVIYFSEMQPRMVAKHPNLAQGEIMKKIARRWKKLDEEEKQKYQASAEQNKLEFQQQLNDMGISLTSTAERPKSAFQLYCDDKWDKMKEKHPEADDEKIQRKLEHRWEKLSDDLKTEYKVRSAKMEQVYVDAQKTPKAKKRMRSVASDGSDGSPKAKVAKITKSSLPHKPGSNLFNYWVAESWKILPPLKNLAFHERMKVAGELWHKKPFEEKRALMDKWEKAIVDYNGELDKRLLKIEDEDERARIRSQYFATMPNRIRVLKTLKSHDTKKTSSGK